MLIRRSKTAVIATLAGALFLIAPPGAAQAESDDVSELLSLNPGLSKAALNQAIDDASTGSGETRTELIETALAEARASAHEAAGTSSTVQIASSGGGTVKLNNGKNTGDIFVSPAATLFIKHGHTGIFTDPERIVEAPGIGKVSRARAAAKVDVGVGAAEQHVKFDIDQTKKRMKAANYAYDNLRGKEYNPNFAFNKDPQGKAMNCSQLVWAAFMITTTVDLDYNGGPGVYPYDLKRHDRTKTYENL